jgi:predicted N-acetyltransferase YhbS
MRFRRLGCGQLSLVALNEEYIIGSVVFSPVFSRVLRFAGLHEVRSSHSRYVR